MQDFLWKNLFKRGRDEIEVIADYWLNTPLFAKIPRQHVCALTRNMHIRPFRAEEIVFHEGDQAAGAILVFQGQVEICAKENRLALLEAGDFFGEIALAENDRRTATAICREDSRLVFFLKQDMEEWIELEPRLGNRFLMNLASVLAIRLHQANLALGEHHLP